jgi:parvulin-like peptidyl-prolyl isomerase
MKRAMLFLLTLMTISPDVAGIATARAADGDALVILNGRPITRDRFLELLIESHGLTVLEQLIATELAEQEAARHGIRVTDADVAAETTAALQRMLPVGDNANVTDADRAEALDRILQQNGFSRGEFLLTMRRNACLRKVVENDLQITEATIQEEFARTYGEKVEVRHIQISVGQFGRVQAALAELDKGRDFIEVVREFSENPTTRANGGLMPPFAFNEDSIQPVLREAAFALKPGEQSSAAILTGQFYHILKCERRIPPEGVTLEQVRPQVIATLRDRMARKRMSELLIELDAKKELRILNRSLRERWEAREASRRQAAPPR